MNSRYDVQVVTNSALLFFAQFLREVWITTEAQLAELLEEIQPRRCFEKGSLHVHNDVWREVVLLMGLRARVTHDLVQLHVAHAVG